MALILAVDDEELVLRVIEMALGDEHLVLAAGTGERALELVRLAVPGLIILDINLNGGLSGLDTCVALRKNPVLGEMPILAISGQAERERISDFLAAGGTTFISKPFSPELLRVSVNRLLESSSISIARELIAAGEGKLIEAVKLALRQGRTMQIVRALRQAINEIEAEMNAHGP